MTRRALDKGIGRDMDWRGKRIVAIDGEGPTRWLLALLFRHRGATVYLAKEGRSGLALVHETNPDLVIIDILLPVMGGREILRTLRQSSDVPVIVLTSVNKNEEIVRCLDAGADDYIVKPFDTEVMLARCWSAVRTYSNPEWKRTAIAKTGNQLRVPSDANDLPQVQPRG
jgi:DNA-binding response OmpR family regulator